MKNIETESNGDKKLANSLDSGFIDGFNNDSNSSEVDKDDKGNSCPATPILTGVAPNEMNQLVLDPSQQRFPALSGEAYNALPTYPLRPSYKDYHFNLRYAFDLKYLQAIVSSCSF